LGRAILDEWPVRAGETHGDTPTLIFLEVFILGDFKFNKLEMLIREELRIDFL
jgi:hypothetical protein